MSDLVSRLRNKTIMVNAHDISKALFEAADKIEQLQAKLDERDALIRDGITHLCSYCMDNKERSWEEMQQHIHVCEKHPLSKLQAQVDAVKLLPDKWREEVRIEPNEFELWITQIADELQQALEQKP